MDEVEDVVLKNDVVEGGEAEIQKRNVCNLDCRALHYVNLCGIQQCKTGVTRLKYMCVAEGAIHLWPMVY